MGEKRNAYGMLVGKPARRRPLGRPRCRWGNTIKMDLTEIGWHDMNWIDLAQDRDQWRALHPSSCMHILRSFLNFVSVYSRYILYCQFDILGCNATVYVYVLVKVLNL
jgi:hypothetical protein